MSSFSSFTSDCRGDTGLVLPAEPVATWQLRDRLRYLKRALLGVFAVAVVVAALLFACHGDRSISTSVLIHGSPRAVWHVLVTTSEYPEWNPMIDRISGDLREGNVVEVDEGMVFHLPSRAAVSAPAAPGSSSSRCVVVFAGTHGARKRRARGIGG